MADITVDDVVRVVVGYALPDGAVGQLVWHYACTAGTTATPQQVGITIAAAFAAAWDNIKSHIGTQVVSESLELYAYDFTLHRFDGVYTASLLGGDGTGTGDVVPQGAALLGKIFTDAARRQARKYLFGLLEGSQSDGLVATAAVTAYGLFLDDLQESLSPGNILLEYCTFNTDSTSPLYETVSLSIASTIAEAVMAYQRRRRPGTGI
jgi:hypothetical protein